MNLTIPSKSIKIGFCTNRIVLQSIWVLQDTDAPASMFERSYVNIK